MPCCTSPVVRQLYEPQVLSKGHAYNDLQMHLSCCDAVLMIPFPRHVFDTHLLSATSPSMIMHTLLYLEFENPTESAVWHEYLELGVCLVGIAKGYICRNEGKIVQVTG